MDTANIYRRDGNVSVISISRSSGPDDALSDMAWSDSESEVSLLMKDTSALLKIAPSSRMDEELSGASLTGGRGPLYWNVNGGSSGSESSSSAAKLDGWMRQSKSSWAVISTKPSSLGIGVPGKKISSGSGVGAVETSAPAAVQNSYLRFTKATVSVESCAQHSRPRWIDEGLRNLSQMCMVS